MIGREAREQVLEAEGRLPEAVIACVGGGSNAIGMFAGFLDDAEVRARRRRGGRRREPRHRPHRRPPRLALVRARRRGRPDRGRALDLRRARLPGRRPRARLPARLRPRRYVGTTDEEALEAFRRLTRTEGIIPALEPSHALARVGDLDAELIVVCLSGRGDKDLAEVLRAVDVEQDARDLPDVRAGDARARGGGRRGRRRHRRARLPVLRPARGRPRGPPRRREGARAGDAHAGVPRVPGGGPGAGGRAARPDDVLLAARGVRLGALRGVDARAPARPA